MHGIHDMIYPIEDAQEAALAAWRAAPAGSEDQRRYRQVYDNLDSASRLLRGQRNSPVALAGVL